MRNQGIKAAGEVMSATPGAPAGHAFPPPNVVKLATFLHTFQQPKEIRSRFVSLIKVCSNQGNQTLTELQISIGDISTGLHEPHFNE